MAFLPPRRPVRLRPVLACAALVAAASATPASGQPRETRPTLPPWFALTDARIVTGTGAVVERGTIVVRDGVIEAVGAEVPVPEGAWAVSAAGLTIYPGLFDAFGTLGHPGSDAREEAAEHSWGPEDRPGTFTWATAADELDPSDPRIAGWREAGFTTALTTFEDGFLPGQAAVIDLGAGRGRDMVVAPAVAQRINLEADFPGYPGSLMGSFAYIEQLYLDAGHYDRAWTRYEREPSGRPRPEYDRALEPLRERAPVLFPATDRTEILRALDTADAIDAAVIVYGAQGAYRAADVLREAGAAALVDLDWPTAPQGADPEAEPDLATLRFEDRAPTTPGVLERAGVRFAFYTGGLERPQDALPAVRRALALGLSREGALRALTLGPAEILGVADRTGTLEAGKIANLLVTAGDLFSPDVEIRSVFVDGREFVTGRLAEAGEEGDDGEGGEGGAGPDGEVAPSAPVPMSADRGPYRDDPVTLIRGATVMTASAGTLEDTDILIRDGKIARVGRGLDAPPGATVVDAAGMYVTPGIIDAHSHIAADAINEGTVNVSAMVGIRDVIDPEDPDIYRALAGGVTAINLLHGSANPIGGRNAVLKLRWGADADDLIFEGAPAGIKLALGENTKRDRDPDRYPASRMGVQDVIRQAFLDAREYQREWDEYRRRIAEGDVAAVEPRRDLRHETLAQILRGERLVHAHSYRADEILQLIRLAEEFGFRIATFQHVLEGYKVADEIAAHGAGASTFSDWWAYKVEAYDAIPYNAALMTERGVTVSINSDDAEEMRHLNQEAAKAIKWGGLSEEEALRLVTLNPAVQLGVEDRVGSIEVGKDADLVIFRGHPLSMLGRVEKTYVDGRLYFDVELDRRRQADVEAEKKALLDKLRGGEGARVVTEVDGGAAAEAGR